MSRVFIIIQVPDRDNNPLKLPQTYPISFMIQIVAPLFTISGSLLS